MFQGSDPTVWVVRDGKSWGVPTGEMVDCLGGWGSVRHVTDAERDATLAGNPYGGAAGCYPNLTMVQGSDPTVWVVKNGKAWGVPSAEMVDCLGGWGAVRHVTDAERDAMRAFNPYGGAAGCYPSGTMVQGSDPTVWVVKEGKSWGVPDADTVDCLGGWSAVNDKFFDPDKGIVAGIEKSLGVSTAK